ncbi:unnamed protein product [Bemisia tabaci]|uniref:Uncharacterized protein n=1 Tax=Bemisia tabaci TaxID=7038 RepID=A0A9P0F0G6_BEMTA|nr:unnamed protein product [Bemisia tabaci]
MYISAEELDGSLDLSDVNFNMTCNLYTNPIWNSQNYLIFMISEFDCSACDDTSCVIAEKRRYTLDSGNSTSQNSYDTLIFCFKFFWRFFRGLKAIICHRGGCSRYDPFTEKIIWYSGGKDEAYFDFSITNMHGKHLRLTTKDHEGIVIEQSFFDSSDWMESLRFHILAELAESLHFTYTSVISQDFVSHDVGQKHDLDLHSVEIGIVPEDIDYSKFDFTVGVETVVMGIITPHSKFMPQCLVPFEVFTFEVWICIVLTCIVFVSMQYAFFNAQSRMFRGLYSIADISLYDSASSIYTIYAYFICGSPPRLLLGKLFTGKILFFVFVFSALIISNVFLGGMTTLLTNTVQYPEIDTMQALEDSHLSIQVSEKESAVLYFSQLGLSEKVMAKFSTSFEHYVSLIANNVNDENLWDFYAKRNEVHPLLEKFSKIDKYLQPLTDKTCDERMYISAEELDGSLDLSDVNFNMTRNLYTNPIWNSQNYLIFMISEFDCSACDDTSCVIAEKRRYTLDSGNSTSQNSYDTLIFCFKFIWRFFRGLKAIICHRGGCSRYDPFTEKIIWYSGGKDEAYFDFSITNMHGKHLRLTTKDHEGIVIEQSFFDSSDWMESLRFHILAELAESLHFTYTAVISQDFVSHDVGQKHDLDLHSVEIGIVPEDIDYSKFDFTVGVETVVMGIITPHSKFMPQCLVPFEVFTFEVWICIVLTCIVFVSMQYAFFNAQSRMFRGLYSMADISLYDSASSIYTIYAYFICGSPPRLLLGKLFTGKILFFVFVFSALIISNVFLGGMTTLLTNTVQYPEIDTMQALEDSHLSIQVSEKESAVLYFSQLGLSEKVMAKFSTSFEHYVSLLANNVNDENLWDFYAERNEVHPLLEKFSKSIIAILEDDAFLISLPHCLISNNRVVLNVLPFGWTGFKYHLVKERLNTFPHVFTFLKNSFFFNAFSRKTSQILETGHIVKHMQWFSLFNALEFEHPLSEDEEPRSYSLNDLQLPFFILVLVEKYMQPLTDMTCDERMYISAEELDGSLDLSDVNFNMTRNLYTNPIWNSQNYLIFMISEFDCSACDSTSCIHSEKRRYTPDSGNTTSQNSYDTLIFSFKFIWRFFRGLKAIICHRSGCSRYDPFAEKIIWYSGAKDEAYFDFSVTNMHGKHLRVTTKDYEGIVMEQSFFDSSDWMESLRFVTLAQLAESLHFTYTAVINQDFVSHDVGQKHDLDLHYVEIGVVPEDIDYSKLDFSVGIETSVKGIITPHSKFMPQCLVPFEVFTFEVWICIVMTCIVFVSMQYAFFNAQSRKFRGLYSMADISLYDSASSIYTIYAYFICGSPPRLLLGKLFTGKILFSVFVFSALIISNVFLGGMTTLLTSTVQYPEIDTMQALEDSHLPIQVSGKESVVLYFSQLGFSEKVTAKFSTSFEHYVSLIANNVSSEDLLDFYAERNEPLTDKTCDERMYISAEELDGSLDLSDVNFNMTRNLYTNPIWNSQNYLIFMITLIISNVFLGGMTTLLTNTVQYPEIDTMQALEDSHLSIQVSEKELAVLYFSQLGLSEKVMAKFSTSFEHYVSLIADNVNGKDLWDFYAKRQEPQNKSDSGDRPYSKRHAVV